MTQSYCAFTLRNLQSARALQTSALTWSFFGSYGLQNLDEFFLYMTTCWQPLCSGPLKRKSTLSRHVYKRWVNEGSCYSIAPVFLKKLWIFPLLLKMDYFLINVYWSVSFFFYPPTSILIPSNPDPLSLCFTLEKDSFPRDNSKT